MSWYHILAARALGLGIALLCLLPPIIHICSSRLGPAIGGYCAGARFRRRASDGLLISLGMGLLSTIPSGTASTRTTRRAGAQPR